MKHHARPNNELFDKHLTSMHQPDSEARIKLTDFDGQASWAGGGPADETCRRCNYFWNQITNENGKPQKANAGHGFCKFRPLINQGKFCKAFANTRLACRYFLRSGR